jgi:hypothetical protein
MAAERNRRPATTEDEYEPTRTQKPKPKKHRLRRWLAALALLLLVLWFLPGIVVNTPLLGWLISKAETNINGSVSVQKVACWSWASPLIVSGVEVRGAEGKPVFSLAAAYSEKSPLRMLLDGGDLGRFHLEQPRLNVILRDEGSNLEDLLKETAEKKEPEREKIAAGISFSLVVHDGAASVTDQRANRTWKIEKLQADIDAPAAGPLNVKLAAQLPEENPPGKLDATLASTAGGGQIKAELAGFPLAMVRAAVARFMPGTVLTGTLTATADGSWDAADASKNLLQAKIAAAGFSLEAPALKGDVAALEQLEGQCRMSWRADRLTIDSATINCDVAQASLSGAVPLGDKGGMDLAEIARQPFKLDGRVDLPRLARLLPNTLQLKKDLSIDSGSMRLSVVNQVEKNGVVWRGQLETSELTATNQGKRLSWRQPIRAAAVAHDDPKGIVVDSLDCDSEFLKIQAAGTTKELTGTLSFNLDRLAEQLGQFVDLSNLRFGGVGSGEIKLKRPADDKLAAEAQLAVNNLQLIMTGGSFDKPEKAAATLNIAEPLIKTSLVGGWDQQSRRLQFDSVSFTSSTLAFLAQGVTLALPEKGPMELAGTLSFQTEIGRLRRWFLDPAKPPQWQLAGVLKGATTLKHSSGTIGGELNAVMENLLVVDAAGRKYQEKISLDAAGDYDGNGKVLRLSRLILSSSALAAQIAGQFAPAADGKQNEVRLNGQLSYDLGRLAEMFRPVIGPNIAVVGRSSTPILFAGPLGVDASTGSAGLKWEQANVYGFQVGQAEARATLDKGVVQVAPLDLAVSRGRMRLAPRVKLAPEPMELTLPAGPLAERIEINPVMCSELLMYIAPVLAEVTSAQGTFSIALDKCRIPLGDPAGGDLAGRITVHSVEVGPGPLVREFALLLNRESPAKLKKESTIAFQMHNRRVYHQNVEMVFPDLTITTQGSVGFDQTLDLVAEMPVPPKWLAKNPLAAQALANQRIRIPLKGTLKKPQLDRQEMDRLSRQFIKQAAGNLIEGELNKQLDRLLQPRK